MTGRIHPRPNNDVKESQENGDVELHVESFQVLGKCPVSLPLAVSGEKATTDKSKEDTRLQYRYLDLRRQGPLQALKLRSQVSSLVRSYFMGLDFLEVETPILFKSTPEGAREFVVPTRNPGQYYALVQSPQQYKQLLMVGGIDRYFQIAKCFRDEDLASDKQPEFTQIDMEMSFVTQEDVMLVMENFVKLLWKEYHHRCFLEAIPRMTFREAIDKASNRDNYY